MKLMRETRIMAVIAMIDLIGTLWLMHRHAALESNPFLQFFLARGILWFIIAKFIYTFVPLVLLEAFANRVESLVRKYLRLGIIVYIGMHAVNLLCFLIARRAGV